MDDFSMKSEDEMTQEDMTESSSLQKVAIESIVDENVKNPKSQENRDEQIDRIMEKLNDFSKLPDDNYEIFSDEKFQEKLYHILQDYKKQLQDKPEGIITLIPKFYEQSNLNELDVEPDLWNEFWNYLERYGITGDEKFPNRINQIVVQPETMQKAFSIMKDIKEYLGNRLYMSSYMRGTVAVNEDIASYYMEKAYNYLNLERNMDFKDPKRNQDMENQIKIIKNIFDLDDTASSRFYTINLGGTGWGSGEKPYFYVTEDLQSSFDAAYASYMASDADGRVLGYSKDGMSTKHLVELVGCGYDNMHREVHMLNYHLENQVFDKDSKVLANIEKKLYEEFGIKPVQPEVRIDAAIDEVMEQVNVQTAEPDVALPPEPDFEMEL